MKRYSREISYIVQSLIFSALYSFVNKENVVGFLINLVFFNLTLRLVAHFLAKRKFTVLSVLLVVVLPIGLVGAKSSINTDMKEKTYNKITFYYESKKHLYAVELIEKNVKPYSLIASKYFGNQVFHSKVKVYLLTADKDIRLRSVGGYYDGEKIVLRVEKDTEINVSSENDDFGELDLPLAFFHEYTHHLTRKSTDKKLPMWFTEGLAEYIARQATSQGERLANPLQFKIVEDDSNWDQYDRGWIYQSSRFYIEEIIELWGEEAISSTLDNLTKGTEFIPALQKAIGLPYYEIRKKLEGYDLR